MTWLTNPYRFGPAVPVVSATYWRIRIFGCDDGFQELAELEFAASPGGANLCTGGTVIHGDWTGQGLAFDGNTGTYAGRASAGTIGATTNWIGYVLPSASDVTEVRIRANTANRGVRAFFLDYSLNAGATWIPHRFGTTASVYTIGSIQTFTPVLLPTTRATALCWSINVTANNTGWLSILEFSVRTSSGGTNLSQGQAAWASRCSNGNGPYLGVDNDTGTYWQSGVGVQTGRFIVNHVTAPNPTYFMVNGKAGNDAPKDFTFEYTLDGLTWTSVGGTTGQTGWSGAAREFGPY